MPVNVGYKNAIENRSFFSESVAYIPQWAIRHRLPPEAQLAFDLFTSLKNLGDFLRTTWQFAPRLTATSRVSVSRVAKSCAKLVSSFKNELPDSHSVITDLYLSEILIELDRLSWWMINHQRRAKYTSIDEGGIVVELTPVGFSALNDVESWQIVEDLLYSGSEVRPFNTNNKLYELLTGVAFVAKRTK